MSKQLRRAISASFILLFCSAFIAALATRVSAYSSAPDARERGAAIFHTRGCEKCHAILGAGGDRAPDLGTVGRHKSAVQIKNQVINGGHGMPPFGDVLSKDEVKDVVTFLTSCRSEDAPGCRKWMPVEAGEKAQ